MSENALTSSPTAGEAEASASKRKTQPLPSTAIFYCAACNIQFSDSHAAAAHKASRKHKLKSGELEWEAQKYKKDADVTPEDVWALVRRQQAELDLKPWSEIRYRGAS